MNNLTANVIFGILVILVLTLIIYVFIARGNLGETRADLANAGTEVQTEVNPPRRDTQ